MLHRGLTICSLLLWLAAPAAADTAHQGRVAADPAQGAPTSRIFFLLGPGLSLGLFHPVAVDDYIQKDLQSRGFNQPMGAMVVAWVPRLAVELAVTPYASLQVVGELGWGPKLVAAGKSYHFIRWSAGGLLSGHIPLRRRVAASLGAGALVHAMQMDEFAARTVGPRVQAAVRWYTGRLVPEVVVAYDVVRARATREQGLFMDELSMDYTCLMFGLNVRFLLAP